MTQRKQRYFNCILITLLSVLLSSCSDNTPTGNNFVNPIAIVVTPMWPQAGYNAQNTSSPYAPYSYCNSVNAGEVDWYYTFPNAYYYDGAEFCIDSRSNIYFLSQQDPQNKIYKFRPDGTVIWISNCSGAQNFAAISLSSDEKYIYFNSYDGMHCYDSSGNNIWTSGTSGYYVKPAIGKEGTIYTKNYSDIAAINPNGSLKWTTNAGLSPYSVTKVALDRDENVYIAEKKVTKTDRNGNIKWVYTPTEPGFLAQSVVIDGFGNLYFVNEWGNTEYNLYSITKDGVLRWKSKVYTESPPAIGPSNKLYMVGNSAYCFDTAGKEIWTKPIPGGLGWGFSVVIDGLENMYFLFDDFQLKAISLNSQGDLRWVVDLSIGGLLPGPALVPNGKMLIAPKRGYKIACVK